ADLSYLRGQDELSTNLGRIMLRPVHIVRSMVQYSDEMIRAHLWYQMFYSSQSMDMPLVYNGIRMGSLPEIMNLANHSTDVELQFTHSFFEGNTLVAGANYRWLGMFWPDNDPPSVYQHRAGLFVQDEQRFWDQLLLLGAVRLDYNSITPFTVSPRAGLVWKPAKNHALRFHFGRAFRKPSFVNTSIHIKTTIPSPGFEGVVDFVHNSIGNENLDNERVTSFEIGYRGAVLDGRLELDADAFFNMYRNAISFQSRIVEDSLGLPDFEKSWLRFENEGIDVDTIGGSVDLEWKPAKWLSARANYTFRHSRYVNVVYIPTKKKGDRVPWEPAHLFNFVVDLKFDNGLRAGAALFARSGIEDFWPEDGGFFADKVRVVDPARVLASGYLSWRISAGDWWVEPGVRVVNAAGGRWRDGTNIRRFDGKIIGDQWMGRLLLLFVRVGWEPEE
ncbi:MAG: TonB-dependent receptor, partial [Deltaproteobacteria bacterium]